MENKKNPGEKTVFTSKQIKTIPNPYEEIAILENGKYQFNSVRSRNWLEKQGKKLFGSHFRIYEEDYSLIFRLMIYAIGDHDTALKNNLSLTKGILLTGPIGCGKTSLMTLINYFFPTHSQYRLSSSREISFEFEREGYKVINRYGKTREVVCFDDLGIEQVQKYYGNECNVMAEILLSRYDLFVSKGIRTHATTNLSASELEAFYGNRVRSRMREMFNLVAFDKGSRDKRK